MMSEHNMTYGDSIVRTLRNVASRLDDDGDIGRMEAAKLRQAASQLERLWSGGAADELTAEQAETEAKLERADVLDDIRKPLEERDLPPPGVRPRRKQHEEVDDE